MRILIAEDERDLNHRTSEKRALQCRFVLGRRGGAQLSCRSAL